MAMQFDSNAINDVDQSTVHIDGTLYPTIQWVYGNPAMKKAGGMDYLGGFFINEETVASPDSFTAAGWEAVEWTHQDGSSTLGFWKRDLDVAVINFRQRWEIQEEDGKRIAFAWTDYDMAKEQGNPSGRLHALVLVKGLETEGQFVITFRGMGAKSFYARNSNDCVLSQFQRTVITAANRESDIAARKNSRQTGKRWPYRAFWLPVGASRDDKGNPVYIKAGTTSDAKSVVLPAAMGLPTKPAAITLEDLGQWYVGNEILAEVNTYYEEAEANWSHAWDQIEPGVNPAPAKDDRLPESEAIALGL